MPTLEFETIVAAPLAKVWEFYDDPIKGIPALTTPAREATVESADLPMRVGSRVIVVSKGPLDRKIRMVVKIVERDAVAEVVARVALRRGKAEVLPADRVHNDVNSVLDLCGRMLGNRQVGTESDDLSVVITELSIRSLGIAVCN
jgi:hypothetical protein